VPAVLFWVLAAGVEALFWTRVRPRSLLLCPADAAARHSKCLELTRGPAPLHNRVCLQFGGWWGLVVAGAPAAPLSPANLRARLLQLHVSCPSFSCLSSAST
jgi:hypothetical protein